MSSDLMRLAGINSGYDSESMIKEMMSAYQTKIDNQNKKLTKLQWKQEAYRDITQKLTDFQNKYFDILKRDSYLMSPTSFSKFKASVNGKDTSEAFSPISVTTTSGSKEGSYSIKVLQTATKAKRTGGKVNPAGFSLDLEKAAEGNYKKADGSNVRNYDFALDVKVGDVAKTIEFKFDVTEAADGKINMDDFAAKLTDALNTELTDKFGYSGRTGADATGMVNAEGKEYFLAAELADDSKSLSFKVGGNATVSVTEKTGNFGLTKFATAKAISMKSCVTGTNTVSITVGDTTRNVSFEGVSASYFDSREDDGNEAVLAEYNRLKEAAYRKKNLISDSESVSEEELKKFLYRSSDAAADKNTEEFLKAANDEFAFTMVSFSIDNDTLRAWGGGNPLEFTATSIEGGTLGLAKGTATNRITDNLTLKEIGVASGDTEFKVNDKTIKVSANMTVKDLLAAVNKAGANVTMSYSTVENRFVLEASDMGAGGNVDIEENDFTKAIGLAGSGASVEDGKNAIFELDGVQIYHNSNSYETDGTKFDFTDAETDTEYKVVVSKNYDDIKKTIKDFVKDYNQLIDDVYGHIGTAPARDKKNNLYEPLTDEEKEELDEKEIEKWEEKAKQGVIYNDSTVMGIMSQIRTALYNTVTTEDGKKFGLYSMGINTIAYDYQSHGKLEIDEEKLDKAFSERPDAIVKLFTDPDEGVMKKVDTILDNAVSTAARSTGSSTTYKGSLIRKAGVEKGVSAKNNEIFRQMEQINKRIQTLQDRYDSKEEYWWNVFTNLEKMMSEMNSQSSYLSSYLGSGTTM